MTNGNRLDYLVYGEKVYGEKEVKEDKEEGTKTLQELIEYCDRRFSEELFGQNRQKAMFWRGRRSGLTTALIRQKKEEIEIKEKSVYCCEMCGKSTVLVSVPYCSQKCEKQAENRNITLWRNS